jgi:hypothetical protein
MPNTKATAAPMVARRATSARTKNLRRPVELSVGSISVIHHPREWRGPAGAGRENARELTHYTNPVLTSVTKCHALGARDA